MYELFDYFCYNQIVNVFICETAHEPSVIHRLVNTREVYPLSNPLHSHNDVFDCHRRDSNFPMWG